MYPSYQKITETFDRTIVIGDIHGCYEEMLILLKRVNFGSNDVLISVGDLVDRGQYSIETASFFMETQNAFSVLGNHERRVAGIIRGTSHPEWSQLHTLSKIPEDEHDAWADYFETLPAVIETNHAIITHARLDPAINLVKQDPYFTCAVGGEKIKIETDENGTPLWFHEWRRRYPKVKPVCIGHIGYRRIELEKDRLYSLDTGAVKGGKLTMLILPEFKIVSIDCLDYYSKSRQEWVKQDIDQKIERVERLPLQIIFSILNKEQPCEDEKRFKIHFNQSLERYNFEKKNRKLHKKMISKFGELPPPGPKRGDYFKTIRSSLNSGINQRLINLILSDKPYQWEKLANVFKKNSLQNIAMNYSKIENCIEKLTE